MIVAGGRSSTGSSSFGKATPVTSATRDSSPVKRTSAINVAVAQQVLGLRADHLRVTSGAVAIVDIDRHALGRLRRRPWTAAEIDDGAAIIRALLSITLRLRKCDSAMPVGLSSLIWISGMPCAVVEAGEGQPVDREPAVLNAGVIVAAVERLGIRRR